MLFSFRLQDPATHQPRMEKWLLRKAFDTPEQPYLPNDVLWRQKEQFSDGVGYSWIDSLREMVRRLVVVVVSINGPDVVLCFFLLSVLSPQAEKEVTDVMFQQAAYLFPENTPPTKENYLYRSIFVKHFPQHSASQTVKGGCLW